jgi:hypothetical protein
MAHWRAGVGAEGVLVVPAEPQPRCAVLQVRPEGPELVAGSIRCTLAWGALRAKPEGFSPEVPSWDIVPWSSSRSGPVGVAVQVSRALQPVLDPVVDATPDHLGVFRDRSRVPLVRGWGMTDQSSWLDIQQLGGVLAVMGARPDLRPRLAEPRRVRRLVADLEAWPVGAGPDPGGIRRSTTEVIAALRMAGYRHPYGRPLPCEPLPPLDEVVDAVESRLAANPFMEGRHIERHRVEDVVRHAYLDVAPWPLGALSCD